MRNVIQNEVYFYMMAKASEHDQKRYNHRLQANPLHREEETTTTQLK